MKTIRAIAISAVVLLAMNAKAQDTTANSNIEERVVYHNDIYRVETNSFWSNWFLGVGAGTETYFGDHDKQLYWSERITPGAEVYIGKWFTPGIGVRVNAQGWTLKGATHNYHPWACPDGPFHQISAEFIDEDHVKPDGRNMLYYQKWNYLLGRADVLFNLNQMIGGYLAERKWSCTLYAGLGYAYTWDTNKVVEGTESNAREIGLGAGFIGSYRISPRWNINLDISGTMFKDRFDGDLNPAVKANDLARPEEGLFAANLGASFNFGKNVVWGRGKDVTIIDNSHLNELKKALADLDEENVRLKEQLANCNNVDTLIENICGAAPILVTFEIDKIKLRNKDRVNLGFFAEVIKATDPSIIYTITGYADEGTGTPKRNWWLSENRARVVYECLVNEFGVPAERLRTDYKGGVDNMFYDEPKLSRAVITKGTINDDAIIERQKARK